MQAVGIQSTFAKFGAPIRGERVALYNRLGRIADQLDSQGALVPRSEFPFRAIHQPEPEVTDDNTSQIQDDQSIESGSKKGDWIILVDKRLLPIPHHSVEVQILL